MIAADFDGNEDGDPLKLTFVAERPPPPHQV
jgi:hypothetical protein